MSADRRPVAPPDVYERCADIHQMVWNAQVVASAIEHHGIGPRDPKKMIDDMSDLSRVAYDLLNRTLEILDGIINYDPAEAA